MDWPRLDARTPLLTGAALVVFHGGALVVGTAALWWGASLKAALLLPALGLASLFALNSTLVPGARQRCLAFLLFLAVECLAPLPALGSMDFSFDGRWYHKEAVLQLWAGWNPMRHAPVSGLQVGPNGFGGHSYRETLGEAQINSYPKAPWIVGTLFAQAHAGLEAAKAPNFALMAAVFLVTLGAWPLLLGQPSVRLRHAVVASLVAGAPTSVSQLGTAMIDGQLFALVVCLIAFSSLLAFRGWAPSLAVAAALAAIALVNTKFTGLLYAPAILASVAVLRWRVRPEGPSEAFRSLGLLALASALGLGLVGFHPYATNLLRHGSLTPPYAPRTLSGVTPADGTMDYSMPTDLQPLTGPAKLARVLVSESSEVVAPAVTRAKWPWQLGAGEGACYRVGGSCVVAGWGPFFTLALCVAALTFAAMAGAAGRRLDPALRLLAATLGALVLSVLVAPEGWVARYTPQFWLVPVAVAALALERAGRGAHPLRLATAALVCVLGLNAGFVARQHWRGEQDLEVWFRGQMWRLQQASRQQPLRVNFGNARTLRVELGRFGVKYEEVPRQQLVDDCPRLESLGPLRWCAP